jgi:hypothetical protein
MKAFIKTVLFISLCFSSCKKEDPILNPLYGEWQLTEWIFEGRDITDSIEVIWGENHLLYFSGESYSLGMRNPIRSSKDWNLGDQIGYYKLKTEDLKYIELDVISLNSDTALSNLYKINKNYFDIIITNNNERQFFGKFGLNSFKLRRI